MPDDGLMTEKTKKQLLIEFAVVGLAVIIPVSAHANFLSRLFDTGEAANIEPITYSQDTNAQLVPLLKAAIHTDPNPAKGGGDILVSEGALVPSGDIDGEDETANTRTNNGEISVYVVREGDTLSQIAAMYDVSSKTILWANDITDASLIQPGDSLIILPITGVRHVVKDGDSLGKIAKKYDGDVDDILAYNQLASADDISIGDTVVIPGGEIAAPTPTRTYSNTTVATGAGSAGFTHPLPGSVRTQGIHGYNGLDFGAPAGRPVKAAAAGSVIVARGSGWNGGYGLYVVVKHSNGTQTLYSHLSRLAVSMGSYVNQGQTIGYVGSTGRSTGNHLHFEVRGARNPF